MAGRSETEALSTSTFRPQAPVGPTHQHRQTDSFLTAARLIRNGWTDEGKAGRTHFSTADLSVRQPAASEPSPKSEVTLKAPSTGLLMNSRKTDGDKESVPEQVTNRVRLTYTFSIKHRERPAGQAGLAYVHVSGCRTACRQARRFKAPLLPVIAEM